MPVADATTSLARLTPWQARGVIAGGLLFAAFCVVVAVSPLAATRVGKPGEGQGDVALYRAEVERIHGGEGYYRAARAELTARGYPTQSLFNWRLPTLARLLGVLPDPAMGKVLLGVLALAVLGMAFEALMREPGYGLGRAAACALLLTGPLMPCVLGDLFVVHELWVGVLVALSIAAYGVNRPYWGAGLGLAALFLRELALPYCAVAMGLAWWHGRRRELAVWLLGLAVWEVGFGLHAAEVARWIPLDARAHPTGWVQFGGTAFVLSTVQMNAYLLLLPHWVTALWFAAAMLGFAAWQTPLGLRVGLTACLFVAGFAVVGQNFNQYWGAMTAPLFCFGVVHAPTAIGDLWRAATRPTPRCLAAC